MSIPPSTLCTYLVTCADKLDLSLAHFVHLTVHSHSFKSPYWPILPNPTRSMYPLIFTLSWPLGHETFMHQRNRYITAGPNSTLIISLVQISRSSSTLSQTPFSLPSALPCPNVNIYFPPLAPPLLTPLWPFFFSLSLISDCS